MIHRDIKPENILLTLDGDTLVADFGIARALGEPDENRLTQAGLALGTPAYMAPEQATGERGVDARTDQYSLAIVCYEMLVGRPPFEGTTGPAVIAQRFTAPGAERAGRAARGARVGGPRPPAGDGAGPGGAVRLASPSSSARWAPRRVDAARRRGGDPTEARCRKPRSPDAAPAAARSAARSRLRARGGRCAWHGWSARSTPVARARADCSAARVLRPSWR